MSEIIPPGNRRHSARRSPKEGVRVVCRGSTTDLGANLGLSILDLSETGMRLVVKEALTPGQEVAIALDSAARRRPFLCVATVIWCVTSADGTCCVGVRFHTRLRYSDFFQMAVEPLIMGCATSSVPMSPSKRLAASEVDLPPGVPAAPRRRAARHASQCLVRFRISSDEGSADFEATLLDVSETGLGVVSPGSLAIGQNIVLHLGIITKQPALDIGAKAAYCIELKSGAYLLGVEFTAQLAAESLAILLTRMGHTELVEIRAGMKTPTECERTSTAVGPVL